MLKQPTTIIISISYNYTTLFWRIDFGYFCIIFFNLPVRKFLPILY